MRKTLNFSIAFMLLLLSFHSYAQNENVIGFWKVEKVNVGNQIMTPVAKWFKINPDGTYQAGNGWLQNGQGDWNYDTQTHLYSATDSLDIVDDFGGFTVAFENEKMYWEREEEGMKVRVTLVPIEKLPMSPADYLKGIWDLVEITENEKFIMHNFDNEDKHKLFIRWDRVYINFSPEGKKLTGYWHIHGHKPEITLIPHTEGNNAESWRIEVNEKELLMVGISDTNRNFQRKYVRRNTF